MEGIKDLLLNELNQGIKWTKRIFEDVHESKWNEKHAAIESNLNWQMGHILISHYFHGIACIQGPDEIIKSTFSPRAYSLYYGMDTKPFNNMEDKPNKLALTKYLDLVDSRCLEIVSSLKDSDFKEVTALDNPVAKTKRDALLWTVKHRMWHNGQAAMIKSNMNA